MEDISLICVPPNDLLYILKKQTSPPPTEAATTGCVSPAALWLRLRSVSLRALSHPLSVFSPMQRWPFSRWLVLCAS